MGVFNEVMLRWVVRGYCTYCSAPKSDAAGDLPAIERYRSARIAEVAATARDEGAPMWVISGRFGLLEPTTPIPWYDHLLLDEEVEALVLRCAETLTRARLQHLVYYTASTALAPEVAPYGRLVRLACDAAGVQLETVTLPGVPV